MNILKLISIFALSVIIGAAAFFLFPLYVNLLLAIFISVVSAFILYLLFQSSEIEALDLEELENQIDEEIQSSNEEVLVSENKTIKLLSNFKISLYFLLLSFLLYGSLILVTSLRDNFYGYPDGVRNFFVDLLPGYLDLAFLYSLALPPLFFVTALILKLFKGEIAITPGRIILVSIFLGLLGFTFYNPDLVMQIFFWIGGIIVAIAVFTAPARDGRFSSGYKDNKDGMGELIIIGMIFLGLGGLIYWLTQ